MTTYNHKEIEPKWQAYWAANKNFKTGTDKSKPKFYALDMFPYPSGAGLHVGHPEGYTATDILSRFKRSQGYNVLHPMGWDAFGLPAEQYAMDTGNDPAEFTAENIANFKRQINALGFSYDWDREVNTTDPNYYKWTQWIFTKLYEKGLAYEAEVAVNWVEELGTAIANEEVLPDGTSERGGYPVVRKPMRQWMLKITAYAERLLEDLEEVDWPESIKDMQRNWIGKSTGANVTFKVKDTDQDFTVFTTRPDTLFGATYAVLAPEHAMVDTITSPEQSQAVADYKRQASLKSDLVRTDLAKEKLVFGRVLMRLTPLMVKKCQFGLLITSLQATVLELLWRYRLMMNVTGSLLNNLILRLFLSLKVEMFKKQPILKMVYILILIS